MNLKITDQTNTDYKIKAFIFARKLQTFISKLQANTCIKVRYIGINARFIWDKSEYCENFNKEWILLFLDFEKAFDSVEWNLFYLKHEKLDFKGKLFKLDEHFLSRSNI